MTAPAREPTPPRHRLVNPPHEIYLSVWRDGWSGGLQISLDQDNGGFRLKGPKFNGSSSLIVQHKLSDRDIAEIKRMIAKRNELP